MKQSPGHNPALCSHTAANVAGFKQQSVLVLHIWAHDALFRSTFMRPWAGAESGGKASGKYYGQEVSRRGMQMEEK